MNKLYPILEKAMRLSPHDPQLGIWEYHHGLADLGLGHSAEAVDEERRAIDDGFGTYWRHQALAAAYALSGRDNEAKAELAEILMSPQSSHCPPFRTYRG